MLSSEKKKRARRSKRGGRQVFFRKLRKNYEETGIFDPRAAGIEDLPKSNPAPRILCIEPLSLKVIIKEGKPPTRNPKKQPPPPPPTKKPKPPGKSKITSPDENSKPPPPPKNLVGVTKQRSDLHYHEKSQWLL
ncbi:hypothetical protein PUN28_008776 [Cardiocondyla obscurior]|uniref:Uncharacterized protein n=1 Tax=Cardiocondyla obscurior TaxID=286306 RepID=A0AAW2FNV2_9HYME